jgi:hypothetical protein
MELTASLVVQDDKSVNLIGKADVIVNGKFAQFGGRMMTSVSDMILKQFADNFSIKAQAINEASSASTQTASNTADAVDPAVTPKTVEAPKMQSELNGLAIAWMLIKNFFARLFGK